MARKPGSQSIEEASVDSGASHADTSAGKPREYTERLQFPDVLAPVPDGLVPDYLLRSDQRGSDITLTVAYPCDALPSDALQLLVYGIPVGVEIPVDPYFPDTDIPILLPASERTTDGIYPLSYKVIFRSGAGEESFGPKQQFVVDYTPPGGSPLRSLTFADEVTNDAVTPERLAVDENGNPYLPGTVTAYFGQAIGDALYGYIDVAVATAPLEIGEDDIGAGVVLRFTNDALNDAGDGVHDFTFDIVDRAGNRSIGAQPVALRVRMKDATLAVRGGRGRSAPFYYRHSPRLSARTDVPAADIVWWYAGTPPSSSLVFTDTHPAIPLWVGIRKNGAIVSQWVLQPGNVVGTYNTDTRWAGGCIVKDDGSLHGWGSNEVLPPADALDVAHIATTRSAYAALDSKGRIVAWGDPLGGGEIPPSAMPLLRDVVGLAASGGAFVALLADGSIVAWGADDRGGDIPTTIAGDLTVS
jgi:hypothetical protein